MNLNEFQAKELFSKFGLPVPNGKVAWSTEEALGIAKSFPEPKVVIKAQVLTGGRGKAGGVKLANSLEEVEKISSEILGMKIKEFTVKKVLVEEQMSIEKEMYLSFIQDRDNRGYRMIFSEEGGVEIEELARTQPDKVMMVQIEPFPGLVPFQLREVLSKLSPENKKHARGIYQMMNKLYKLFIEKDATLTEINPLIITSDGKCIACDGKISIDNSALYRNKDVIEYRLPEDENPLEREAREKQLNYVKLDGGNIGCLVNGAGLAMTTMDVIKHFGGEPANFLDLGGGAKAEHVKNALKIIVDDDDVNTIFINIFGGIVRCDLVAEGILNAKKELDIKKEMVIRLLGTNDKIAYEMLEKENISVFTAMTAAAKEAVKLSKQQGV